MTIIITGTTASDAGRLLASLRKPVARVCKVCAAEFSAVDARAVYCSPRCLMRQRRKDAKLHQHNDHPTGG